MKCELCNNEATERCEPPLCRKCYNKVFYNIDDKTKGTYTESGVNKSPDLDVQICTNKQGINNWTYRSARLRK